MARSSCQAHVTAVQQSMENGRSHHFATTERGPPRRESDVGGNVHRHPNLEVTDKLEEQVGRLVTNQGVAQFIKTAAFRPDF